MPGDRNSRERRKLVGSSTTKATDFVRFVQWDSFVNDWHDLGLDDDDLRALETAIMAQPKSAPVVPGTAGLRKLRFAPPRWQTGKSGAARVCYVYFEEYAIVLLLVAYSKHEQDNLTANERATVKALIQEIHACLERGPGQ